MIDTLRRVPLLANLSDEQLQWVLEHGREMRLNNGDLLFAEGSPADSFYVLLAGELQITKRIGGQETVLATHQAGGFTGEIPLLTGTPYIASARALRTSHLLQIRADAFKTMLVVCSPVASVLLPAIAQRIQITEALMRQNEKLAALGKLSAGLAHELNNPAAAGRRAAKHARETLRSLQSRALKLNQHQLTPAQQACLTDVLCHAMERTAIALPLDPLAQSDREDELGAWLQTHDVTDGWNLAPTLVSAGIDTEWLDALADQFSTELLGDVLPWLEATLMVEGLLDEIEQSTSRIADLVKAVKAYTYMDQAPVQEVDIHAGLENTLTILGHKLKGDLVVLREYDQNLPRISAYGSELNQVWTNLIDNAIDALGGRGRIWIRTSQEGNNVLVEIADNGPGIPPEIQPRIFEPFFTTKGVSQGTGLGLDISYRIVVGRHKGDIRVTSKPGDTRFQVRLPIGTER